MTPDKALPRFAMCLAAILLAACDIASHNQTFVIEKARSIKTYPVSRTSFVNDLGLSRIQSVRINFLFRSKRFSREETWQHPSGLTICAVDWKEYPIEPYTQQMTSVTLEGLPGKSPQAQPSQSFNLVIISSKWGEVLFRSNRNKPGHVEPPGAGQPATNPVEETPAKNQPSP